MNKTVAIVLLVLLSSFTQAMYMEKVDTINTSALQLIGNLTILIKKHSSDGSKIVTLDSYGTVSLWDENWCALDKYLADYSGKINQILTLQFNREGTKILITTLKGVEEYSIEKHSIAREHLEDSSLDKDTNELPCCIQ
ncbi:hypothetical protein H0X06_02430 [Candidatus Dependentiae bacterium]|nr:hypothetical protein [Candidatus Dependentiae bacterium]